MNMLSVLVYLTFLNWVIEVREGRKKKELCEELKKGYKEMAAINLEWAENCLDADNQCQSEYEEKLSECE